VFEEDVTVPAGWYPDPMGLPQLRWWNNHAWTELTTEARPPLVMQQPTTRTMYADDELPTRRQQREQREREDEYARLATDESDERDAPASQVALTTTLREIDPPASAEPAASSEPAAAGVPLESHPEPVVEVPVAVVTEQVVTEHVVTEHMSATHYQERADIDEGDSSPSGFSPEGSRNGSGYDASGFARSTFPARDTARLADSFESIFQPRSATSAVSAPNALYERSQTADPATDRSRTSSLPQLAVYTAPVWIIALLPLFQLVVGLLWLVGFGAVPNSELSIAAFVVPYLLVIVLAIADRAILRRIGHEHTANWAWAILFAPVYLIARSMSLSRSGGLGLGPLLAWSALGMLQVASVLVVPGMLLSVLPTVFSAQAEQSVTAGATVIGATLAVHCPSPPPLLIGQQFTCTATSTTGHDLRVTVSLQRANGWINWRVDDWGNTFKN
jgi:hypothetical protein